MVGKVVAPDKIQITDPETFRLIAARVITKLVATADGLYLTDSGGLRKDLQKRAVPPTDPWGFYAKSLSPGSQRRNGTRALAGRLFDSELLQLADAIRRSA